MLASPIGWVGGKSKLRKTILDRIPFTLLLILVGCLFLRQRDMERRFNEHWHFLPKPISIVIDEPRITNNIPYTLTKPKPKLQQSSGYIFWSYSCGR